MFLVSVVALPISGLGCAVLLREGDEVNTVAATWTGVTTPLELIDADGEKVPALALTVWAGPPVPPRTLGLLDLEAQMRQEAAPLDYILIRPGDTHGRINTIVDPATVPAYRVVEVQGVMSEAGYGVSSLDRRRLGRASRPTVLTRVQGILVKELRVLYPRRGHTGG